VTAGFLGIMTNKQPPPSRHAKRRKRDSGAAMSARETKQLAAVARMPDFAIDTRDIPEVTDWREAWVGQFYRATKKGKGNGL
jgi:hypothetical protein